MSYEIRTLDNYLAATGKTNQGFFETNFITDVQHESNQININQLEVITDLAATQSMGQLAITYRLPKESMVDLKIINLLGQVVKNFDFEIQGPGNFNLYWDFINDKGKRIANGLYFYVLQTKEGFIANKFNFVDGLVIPGAGTTASMTELPSSAVSLFKPESSMFKIKFMDSSNTVHDKEFQVELPDSNLLVYFNEIISFQNQPYNLREGDTLKIPVANFIIKTGSPKDIQVFHNGLEYFIADSILNIFNKDPYYTGNRNIPITVTAPHNTDSTINVTANWTDITRFSFQIRDLANNDTTVYSTTMMVLDTNPNTLLDDKVFTSEDGIISGKIIPGIYRVMVQNDNMWKVFKIETADQDIVFHKNNAQYYNLIPYPKDNLNLNIDLEGTIRMVNKSFDKDTYVRIFYRSGKSFIWAPNQQGESDAVKTIIKQQGLDGEVDPDTINVFIWSQGTDQLQFPFNRYTTLIPQEQQKQMSASARQQILDVLNNELPEFIRHQYKINIYEGNYHDLPLIAFLNSSGDTLAHEKKDGTSFTQETTTLTGKQHKKILEKPSQQEQPYAKMSTAILAALAKKGKSTSHTDQETTSMTPIILL